jgi:purine-binding chemotaxis protein CheW
MTESIIPLTKGEPLLTRHSKSPDYMSDGPLGFLCFALDDQEFGVDLNLVAQIVKPPPVTWVPRAATHVLGVISIRGAVVTLIDLRQLLDLGRAEIGRSSRVLIVELEGEQVGLLVDRVTQVRRIDPSRLERDPSLREGSYAEFILFVARPSPQALTLIIDLDAILGEKLK